MKRFLHSFLKVLLVFILIYPISFVYAQTVPDANGVLFVKKGSTGDGSSWANALGEVSEALRGAALMNTTVSVVKQIWVAKGTYLPAYPVNAVTTGTATNTNRYNSFVLVKDTKIYGGFAGNETDTAGRNFITNTTILSGDIGTVGTKTDNAYRVVVAAGEMGDAAISGFTISDAYCQVSGNVVVNGVNSNIEQGGGITVRSATLLIEDVILTKNYNNNGAGAACYAGSGDVMANVTFRRVNVLRNSGLVSGAGIYATYANVQIENTTGSFNTVTGGAGSNGAMFAFAQSATVNCMQSSFNDNKATVNGGAIFCSNNAIATFSKCEFLRDTCGQTGGAFYTGNSANLKFENCAIKGCVSNSYVAVGYVNGATGNVTIINSQVTGNYNTSSSDLGIIRVGGGILNIINTTISGNNKSAIINAGTTVNVFNSIIYGNGGGITGTYTASFSTIQGAVANAGTHITNADPLFVSSNAFTSAPFTGGDYSLQSISPAINAGSNSLYTGLNATTKDLKGNLRVPDYSNGGVIDLGAYEFPLASQTINPIANIVKAYGDADFEPGATATSGLTVSYVSADNAIAEAYQDASDGNKWKIKINKAGTVNITAKQIGDNAYVVATNVVFALTIDKADQIISFLTFGAKNTASLDFEPVASVNTGLALTFASSNTAVATVYQDGADGNKWKIKIIGDGQTDITATQAGTTDYNLASLVRQLTVTPITLPVTLTDFSAKADGNRAKIEWTTSAELNNDFYEVERSIDGVLFNHMATVQGNSSTSTTHYYTVYDHNPANGTTYYRLKQYDKDGSLSVLGERSVSFKLGTVVKVSVFPNPTSEKVSLSFESYIGNEAKIVITDITGRTMHTETIRMVAGTETYSLSLNNRLMSGQYIINVMGTGLNTALKLIAF